MHIHKQAAKGNADGQGHPDSLFNLGSCYERGFGYAQVYPYKSVLDYPYIYKNVHTYTIDDLML